MNLSKSSQFILFLFLLLAVIRPLNGIAQSKTGLLLVTKVSDGDTFWVTHPSGKV